jgi:hypothetical protein
MADLFAEADDALRRERFFKLWTEYKFYIIAFIVGTIVLTGLISTYRSWDEGVKQKQTAQVIAMQTAKDYPENVLKAEKLELRTGLKAVMLLDAAGAFMGKKDIVKALQLYERVSADTSLSTDFRDLGTLMGVRIKENDKTGKAEELLGALEPIYNNAGSPWAAHARLEAAVIEANLNTDFAAARTHLDAIQDTKELPESLHQKAQFLDHLYSLKQPAQQAKTEEKS